MIQVVGFAAGFPKSARLLKRRDFHFARYRLRRGENFSFYCSATGGCPRIGISIPKKVLRNATARNRVRRLAREAFRCNFNTLNGFDIHMMARRNLAAVWKGLGKLDLVREFELLGDFLAG